MKTILVTGGAGFIGSNFINYVLQKYSDIKIINLDKLTYCGNLNNLKKVEDNPDYDFVEGSICDPEIVNPLVEKSDIVVNFAAETHVDNSIKEPLPFIKTDVHGVGILLNSVRKHGVEKFIQISTDEVYGEALHKEGSRVTDPLMPKSPYAASKAGGDRLAYSYYETYNLPVIITRCSNNYGPYQYPEKLIPLFVTNLIQGKKLPVYGDGENTRDWIHVLDHCRAIEEVMNSSKDFSGKVFNIGGMNEKSVLEIANIILDYFDKGEEYIDFVKDRLGHVNRHAVNIDKTRKVLGWSPEISFNEGITETIEWYETNEWWWRSLK